jgi:hypothetical protein
MLCESSFPRNFNHVIKIIFITFSNSVIQTSLHFTKLFRSKPVTILLESDVYILFVCLFVQDLGTNKRQKLLRKHI